MPKLQTRQEVVNKVLEDLYCFNGCWESGYNGGIATGGYPQVCYGGRRLKVATLLYEEFFGLVPKGLELDHTCNNKPCVNPLHLEPVTHYENISRTEKVKKARARITCKNGHEKSKENVYIRPDGRLDCRRCKYDALQRFKERRGLVNATREEER